jgi:hypothetical protein
VGADEVDRGQGADGEERREGPSTSPERDKRQDKGEKTQERRDLDAIQGMAQTGSCGVEVGEGKKQRDKAQWVAKKGVEGGEAEEREDEEWEGEGEESSSPREVGVGGGVETEAREDGDGEGREGHDLDGVAEDPKGGEKDDGEVVERPEFSEGDSGGEETDAGKEEL